MMTQRDIENIKENVGVPLVCLVLIVGLLGASKYYERSSYDEMTKCQQKGGTMVRAVQGGPLCAKLEVIK